jgi:hypothetical protein
MVNPRGQILALNPQSGPLRGGIVWYSAHIFYIPEQQMSQPPPKCRQIYFADGENAF